MNDLEKEQFLHKMIAGSAFVFSLCLLPVAQYYLVSNQLPNLSLLPTPTEQGQVAGVSTDKSIIQADVPSLQACQTKKDQDLQGLALYAQGKEAALLHTYETTVQPYEQAKNQLQGTPEHIQSEKSALDSLIDQQYQPYLKKLSDVEGVVASQKTAIESRSCLPE